MQSHIFAIRNPGLRLVTARLKFVVRYSDDTMMLELAYVLSSVLAKIHDDRTS